MRASSRSACAAPRPEMPEPMIAIFIWLCQVELSRTSACGAVRPAPSRMSASVFPGEPGGGWRGALLPAARPSMGSARLVLVVFDQRVGRVVVNRLEVLGFDGVARDTAFRIERQRDIAHDVLDELRVRVRALGDV